MDALGPRSGIQEVAFMKATQIGVTEAGNNWIFHTIDVAPCSMMAVFPTDLLAIKHSKQKLSPAIEATPRLRGKVASRRVRDGENTILGKSFPNGYLWMSGSNSGANFRSMTVKNIFLDDIDGFCVIPTEGDPISLAMKRTDSYGARRKIFFNSTPTEKGSSYIEAVFNGSDQRFYHVPCPLCGHFQVLEWGGKDADFGIRFARDPDGIVVDVWYECAACHGRIEEHEKTGMLEAGRWVPTFPERSRRGYQLSSLYSPVGWVSWKQIVEEFLQAVGNTQKMKVWVNTRRGLPFEERGDQPEWAELKVRSEPYQPLTVPPGVRLLTAGVDVMDTFLTIVVAGWGSSEECWIIYHGELFGDPAQDEIWKQLDAVVQRPFETEGGGRMLIESVAVDSGGHHTQGVYRYARHRFPIIMAVKGSNETNAPLLRKPTDQDVTFMGQTIKGGVQLWSVGTGVAKATIYSRMRIPAPGPGFIHFPIGLSDAFFLELTAEKHVERIHKGYARKEWVQIRSRNHALDGLVYAYAAAIRKGAHLLEEPKQPAPPKPGGQRQSTEDRGSTGWIKRGQRRWI